MEDNSVSGEAETQDTESMSDGERSSSAGLGERNDFQSSIFKKRKHKTSSKHHNGRSTAHRVKRARAAYTNAYAHEYNQTVLEAVSGPRVPAWPYSDESQVGNVHWSSTEKERLFLALERFSSTNVSAVSAAVASKSELEVCDYLQLLERGAIEHELTQRRADMRIRSIDIPAAAEINPEMCDALEQVADALCYLTKEDDSREEKARYPDDWLMTQRSSENSTQPLNDISHAQPLDDKSRLSQAADLLDVRQMLELSDRVFMNGPDSSESWRHEMATRETPSMFASALIDFHTLTLEITKKVVAISLFNAMTRLRSSDAVALYNRADYDAVKGPAPMVRRSDVCAATNSLGLPYDSTEFWRDAPRRLGLQVYDTDEVSSYGYPRVQRRRTSIVAKAPPLSLEEVEYLLSHPFSVGTDLENNLTNLEAIPQEVQESVETRADGLDNRYGHTTDKQMDHESSSRTSSSMSSVLSLSGEEDDSEGSVRMDGEEDPETAYLEDMDNRDSHREEAYLLSLLPLDLRPKLFSPGTESSVQAPASQERQSDAHSGQLLSSRQDKLRRVRMSMDPTAWSKLTAETYVPEWERYGRIIPNHAFEETAQGTSAVRRRKLSPLLRADIRGKYAPRSRSVSRGRSRHVSVDHNALNSDTSSSDSNVGDILESSHVGRRRSTRSASRARVDYSNNGFGSSIDPAGFSPAHEDNPESDHMESDTQNSVNAMQLSAPTREPADVGAVASIETDDDTREEAEERYFGDSDKEDDHEAAPATPPKRTRRLKGTRGGATIVPSDRGSREQMATDAGRAARAEEQRGNDSSELAVMNHRQAATPPRLGRAPKTSLWSPDEDARLRDAHDQGMSWAAIAKEIFPGKTLHACQQRFQRLERQRRARAGNDR